MKTICKLLSVILIVATVLSLGACGKQASLKNLLDKNYAPSYPNVSKSSKLTELNDYVYEDDNGYLAVFSSSALESTTHKIYSFKVNRVVASYTSDVTTSYQVSLVDNADGYVLRTTKLSLSELQTEVSYSLYSGTADLVAKKEGADASFPLYSGTTYPTPEEVNPSEVSYIYRDQLFIWDGDLYEVDESGSFTNKGQYKNTTPTIDEHSDKYYYSFKNEENNRSVTVFDKSLNAIFEWTAPMYVSDLFAFVLANGNVLIQYVYKADPVSEKYDIFHGGEKYFIRHLLLTPDNKKVATVNINYAIGDVVHAESLAEGYSNKTENLAAVYSINEKRIDKYDVVTLNNNGTVGNSLMVFDMQASLPLPVAANRFAVYLSTGEIMIIDADCREIAKINSYDSSFRAGYIVTDTGIYSADHKLIYDLKTNDAEVIISVNDTVFIKQTIDESTYKVLALTGVSVSHIVTISESGTTSFMPIHNMGYVIRDSETNSSSYYTAGGKNIISLDFFITTVAYSADDSALILAGTNNEGHMEYYRFEK